MVRALRDSQPIQSALVRARIQRVQTWANDMGYFRLDDLAPGKDTLWIGFIGHNPALVPVELPTDHGLVVLAFLGWSCLELQSIDAVVAPAARR